MFLQIVKTLGPRWALFRLVHAAKLKLGWFKRRLPCRQWQDAGPVPAGLGPGQTQDWQSGLRERLQRFSRLPSQPAGSAGLGESAPTALANRILAGETCYFFHHWFQTGFPPDWFANPFDGGTGSMFDVKRISKSVETQPEPTDLEVRSTYAHWSDISDFGNSDIKIIWEPSRFSFVYPLAAAYEETADNKYAEAFWQAVEDWREKNPPQCGPNWMCGQEVAVRMIAWVYGYNTYKDAPPTTKERARMLGQMIAVSAERIDVNIKYALSQNNNHGISEAAGLFTAGIVLDHVKWRNKGKKLLEIQARRLIYDDGSFSQHSTNYHLIMLDAYHWVLMLAEANEVGFSDELHRRVKLAEDWLEAMTDPVSGNTPNLGCNDSGRVVHA